MTEEFHEEKEVKNLKITDTSLSGFWSEKVHIITEDYEISGYIFMPKTGRKNRILSDILNGKRRFIAVKDAIINKRKTKNSRIETSDFIQLNLDSIILIRPILECTTD